MAPLYRIPRWAYPLYEEGKAAARRERETNPDPRTALLDEVARKRRERDRELKVARTMQIARDRTAERQATASSRSQAAA